MRVRSVLILCASALIGHPTAAAETARSSKTIPGLPDLGSTSVLPRLPGSPGPPPPTLGPDLRRGLLNPLDRSQCSTALKGSIWQPGLPDAAASAELGRVDLALRTATPAPLPDEIKISSEALKDDWDQRRAALASSSGQARVHIAAFEKVRGQIRRLGQAAAGADTITSLEAAQMARAASGKLPSREDFLEAILTPAVCVNSLLNPDLETTKTLFRMSTSDLRFGLPFVAIVLTTGADDAVVPDAGLPPFSECEARRSKGEKLNRCARLPPLDVYYVVSSQKCQLQGLLPALPGQPARFGCVMWSTQDVAAPLPQDVTTFHGIVREVGQRAISALPGFQASDSRLTVVDRPVTSRLVGLLGDEAARVAQWRAELDQLHRQIQKDHTEADGHAVARDRASKDQQTHGAAAVGLSTQVATEEMAIDADYQALDRLGMQLAQNQAKEQALALQCSGATYQTCKDDAAKLAYDRQRYEVREERNKLRTAEQTARADIRQRRDRYRQLEQSQRSEERAAETAGADATVHGTLLKVVGAKLNVEEKRFAADDPHNRRLAEENGRDRESAGKLANLVGLGQATPAPSRVGGPP